MIVCLNYQLTPKKLIYRVTDPSRNKLIKLNCLNLKESQLHTISEIHQFFTKEPLPQTRLLKLGSYVRLLKVCEIVDRKIGLRIVRANIFSDLKQKTH